MPRLSAKAIVNFQNINSYKYANQWIVSAGNTNTLYFQLVDLDSACSEECSLRYIAGVGTSNQPTGIRVTFPSVDCNQVIVLLATQDPNDGSIWSVTIPSVKTPQTGAVQFQIFEGNNIRSFTVQQMMVVNYQNSGGDGRLPDNTFFF
jgi:hypothetical protein